MDSKVKAKWIERLESGKDKQCFGQLHEGRAFCVMGLLGDIFVQEFPDKAMWDGPELVLKTGSRCLMLLPELIYKWAGLPPSGYQRLLDLNDNFSLSFKDLAEVIREQS